MDIESIREYCLQKPLATEEFPFDETTLVFKVAGKMFACLPLERSDEKVAYHASCHLCRALGVREAPRALIRRAANYMPSAEEESCCGFGGTFSAKFPEISAELMRKKLASAAASGAKRIALDCPGCAMQLKGGADKGKTGLKVSHISEILAKSIR
jgi:Fe-S oxidoreductase